MTFAKYAFGASTFLALSGCTGSVATHPSLESSNTGTAFIQGYSPEEIRRLRDVANDPTDYKGYVVGEVLVAQHDDFECHQPIKALSAEVCGSTKKRLKILHSILNTMDQPSSPQGRFRNLIAFFDTMKN